MRWIALLSTAALAACAGNGLQRASAAADGPQVDTDSVFALVRVADCKGQDLTASIDLRALDTDAPLPFMRPPWNGPPTVCEIGGQWPSLRTGQRRLWIRVQTYPSTGQGRIVELKAPIDPRGRLKHEARDGVEVWTWICRIGRPCTDHPIAQDHPIAPKPLIVQEDPE